MTDTKTTGTHSTTGEPDFLDALEQEAVDPRSPSVQERDGVPPQERPEQDQVRGLDDLGLEGEVEERSPIVQNRAQGQGTSSKQKSNPPKK